MPMECYILKKILELKETLDHLDHCPNCHAEQIEAKKREAMPKIT